MSYVHLSNGKFRRHLPERIVKRWGKELTSSSRGRVNRHSPQSSSVSSHLAFLSSNTPSNHVWNLQEEPDSIIATGVSDQQIEALIEYLLK